MRFGMQCSPLPAMPGSCRGRKPLGWALSVVMGQAVGHAALNALAAAPVHSAAAGAGVVDSASGVGTCSLACGVKNPAALESRRAAGLSKQAQAPQIQHKQCDVIVRPHECVFSSRLFTQLPQPTGSTL